MALCALSCFLITVVPAKPEQRKSSTAGGGPERLDFDLGQNGEYRFDYATGGSCSRVRFYLNSFLKLLLFALHFLVYNCLHSCPDMR